MGRSPAIAAALTLVVGACQSSPAASPSPSAGQLGQPAASAAASKGEGLDEAIQDVSQRLLNPQSPTSFSSQNRDLAVVASKLALSPLSPQGTVTVTGQPGAIPKANLDRQLNLVEVDSIDTATAACANANPDGSFSITLPSGPGASLLITARFRDTCKGQGPITAAGALLRVPEGVQPGPTLAFRVSGNNGKLHWTASGELLGPAASLQLESPDAAAGGECYVPRLGVYRLFDALGGYVTQQNVNVHGPVLTPTGLPLETEAGPSHYWALAVPQPATQCLRGQSRYDISRWTDGLDPGWYRAHVMWYLVRPNGRVDEAPTGEEFGFDNGVGLELGAGVGYLPLTPIGNPQPPIVPATLFNDAVSWASGGVRGAVAKEDEGKFGLSSRTTFPGPFIASPRDPLSGRRVRYALEPFLPSFAHTGFDYVSPQPAMMLDDRQPGRLSVSLTKPDGKTTDLAKDAPITQAFISGTGATGYPVETSFSGPGRTYGVTTGLPGLVVDFDQYGKHTLALSGTLRSAWGQDMRLRGTYEITVAEPLDLSLGTFQGTPLEVGAELSPVVQVHPGVPADVQVSVDLYASGDASKKQPFQTSGKANRSGYFVAKDVFKASAPGEYMARYTATWTDPANGVLWMATRASASVVATPNTPLIGHGERNSNIEQEITHDGQLRTWFFTRTVDPKCGEAACDPIGLHGARTVGTYPFFRGDVAWIADMSPIQPSVTLEDPTGVLSQLAPQVVARGTSTCSVSCPAPDMRKLESWTSAGSGASGRPNAVDSWAYWYTSAVHADGINIRNIASEFHANHNHWYGHESYGCQIGLPCYRSWDNGLTGENRQGELPGDLKLNFGGAVIKSATGAQFVPYASMAVLVPQRLKTSLPGQNPPTYSQGDAKGNRVCPPFQGAAGGLATCGPLLSIQGLDYDLFVTPTGTRPGAVLEPGDTFVFSGQAWPTLDVGYAVTVTSPSGKAQSFNGRASSIGYIDSAGKSFAVSEPGVYTVTVAATADRPLPSTGIAPSTPIVADGKTPQKGYPGPLSAILGTKDSTYHFTVATPRADVPVATEIVFDQQQVPGRAARTPATIALTVTPPAGASDLRVMLGRPGLVLSDAPATGSPVRVELSAAKLAADGFTNIVLGASSIDITVTGKVGSDWFVRTVNLRGMTPFGAGKATLK